ncbi:MAG: hypothetical protein P4M11_02870 [Candidatus Pacebacteria bacterium]|nr:hypothetical protein [Candidatus Paceibacterota bacterium]
MLGEKIDNLIPVLLFVAKKDFREKFRKPERDPITGLYVENMTSSLINSGNRDTIFLAKL